MSEGEALVEAWEEWLRSMYWTHFATGTWQTPIGPGAAMSTVERWLAKCPEAYAAVGLQKGPVSQAFHVHLLIGGVNALGESLLRRSWIKSGHVNIGAYRVGHGAVSYLVRQAEEIELIGDPLPFRPRRKRRPRMNERCPRIITTRS